MVIYWRSLILLSLASLLLTLPGNLPKNYLATSVSLPSSPTKLHQQAKTITVRVLSKGEFLGSGTLIQRQKNTYTIVTNAHVLRAEEPPYQIQTFDDVIYDAQRVETPKIDRKDDLALLQFRCPKCYYEISQMGTSTTLTKGQDIYTAGFKAEDTPESQTLKTQFLFKTGKIVLVLEKPLKGGYQIGYTNDVEKGMSGGPVLDTQGKLVGVNGTHAYPLWETREYYEDNSLPSESLQTLIDHSSWAVPIEKFKNR